MHAQLSLHGLKSISRPVVVRLTAILLMLSISLPMVMFAEWRPASANTRKVEPRPVSAPPEPFVMPGEKRGWESLGEKLSGLSVEVASLFATKDQQSVGNVQTPDAQAQQQQQVEAPQTENLSPNDAETAVAPEEKEPAEVATEAPAITEAETNLKEAAPVMMNQPAPTVDFDFDADGKADVGRWHPATKEFKVKKSDGGAFLMVTFMSAASSAKPAPADYDGDGKTDPAVFDAGTWYINKSSDNNPATITTISSFGQAGDIPMSGNYRNTDADELAVYRPSTGYWYWRELDPATQYSIAWGQVGDIPAPGDYDADGKVDWTVFRPSTGYWYVLENDLSGYSGFPWGTAGDIPVSADYTGDGIIDPAVYRPADNGWFYLKSNDSYATYGSLTWGNLGDQPVVGDFDDDDKADFTVFRPSSGKWHTWTSQNAYQAADLGGAGDTAIPSSYVKQIGSQIVPEVINKERLKPRNATGGTDLYSQNFGWSRGLINLPGRSGMDLNVGLSYNSLIWTKVDTAMLFDMDAQVGMAPGFHIGFPTIEPSYYYDDIDKWNYLMVTPSGARVEFRQTTGAANVYETYDSSYAQITSTTSDPNEPVENVNLNLVTTDGTQMIYDWISGAFRCIQIKDRNGNYISITYDSADRGIATITDTLGRVVTFNYTGEKLTSITQTWKTNNGQDSNTTHTYATFTYVDKEVQTDFNSSLWVWGPYNGTDVKVLDKVAYADGSFTEFHYNDYLQVFKIEEHPASSNGTTGQALNYVRVNLNTEGDYPLSGGQPDAPRFSKVWNQAQNFNSGSEILTDVTRTANQSFTLPGSLANEGTLITVTMTGHPHNAVSKMIVAEDGVFEGLTLATEDWADGTSGSERKRWSWTSWIQDVIDGSPFSYTRNPRIVETQVGDGTNTKRTTVAYEPDPEHVGVGDNVARFGLPSETKTYDTDLTSVLRQTNVTYNFNSNFLSRRIIGLPASVEVQGYDQIENLLKLVSKTSYEYDEGNFSDTGLGQDVTPAVGHDNTNYGTSFSYRGNLTSTNRWDVGAPETESITTSTLKYNIAGSVVAKITPWNETNTRTVKIGYADSWNSSGNPATYAYPTSITDPADNSSTVKYRYDIGANVEANSPAPEGQIYGKTSKRTFDSVGRLERNSVYVNTTEHSYVRYEYPTNGVQTKTYAPIVDQNNNGNIAEDEVYSESWHDGAGRVRQSRTEHPGSYGGWASTFVEYDILGRVKRQSVPTETNSSYTPTGDDAAGALWAHQKYDWMGRVVRKINTDGADSPTLNDSDVLISYDGCGCAGGLVTTVDGELVPRTDTTGNARRKQKSYADILGRTFKTETYEWDGTTVYATTVQTFDGADRPVLTRQYAGTTSSATYQDTTATFDGYGRLYQSHRPEQRDNSNNLKYTTFSYNLDGSVQSQTDGRGAGTAFMYNSRGLVTNIASELPTQPTFPFRRNYALAANGATGSASSTSYTNMFPIAAAFNGDRKGTGWGTNANGGWNDNTNNSYPDWLQADFGAEKVIDEIDVFTIQDNEINPADPNLSMTFTEDGIIDFDVEYWDGSGWETVPDGNVTGNDKVWRKFTFEPITTSKIRVVVNYSGRPVYRYSRIAELEAWGPDDTAPVVETDIATSFSYDNLGNRLTMTDNSGTQSYEYNSLSQLVEETRTFSNADFTSAPPDGMFKLQYEYLLTGALKSYTDPYGEEIEYGYQKTGRLAGITGSEFDGVTTYAEDAAYRAWGALKYIEKGQSKSEVTFNSRLLPATMLVNQIASPTIKTFDKEYDYYADGRLKMADNNSGSLSDRFDRLFTFDHQGRIKTAKSGIEAHGQTETDLENLPYRQSYTFDAFGNVTSRDSTLWNYGSWDFTYNLTNNRTPIGHDNDGRKVSSDGTSYYYNAAGQLAGSFNTEEFETLLGHDGDGQEIRRTQRGWQIEDEEDPGSWGAWGSTYFIHSTVLGKLVTEAGNDGAKRSTYVYGAGSLVAQQKTEPVEVVSWRYTDASGLSSRGAVKSEELDGLGNNLGTIPNLTRPDRGYSSPSPMQDITFGYESMGDCELDGIMVPCSFAFRAARTGGAYIDYVNRDWLMYMNSRAGGGSGGTWVEYFEPDSYAENLRGTNNSSVTTYAGASSWLFVADVTNITWDFHPVDEHEEGGGGGGSVLGDLNKGPKAAYSAQRLRDCLGDIGITVDEIDFDRNTGGSFKGTFTSREGGGTLSLETSVNVLAKDSASLANALNNTLEPGQTSSSHQAGLTLGLYPKTNWIASDVAANSKTYTNVGLQGLFIHELGNSIAKQLMPDDKRAFTGYGVNHPIYGILNDGDKDYGTTLENCVFGGIVGLRSGRVGANREL